MTIGGQRFQGTMGPQNVEVDYGDTFSWHTDGSVVQSGWTICLTPSGGATGMAPHSTSHSTLHSTLYSSTGKTGGGGG